LTGKVGAGFAPAMMLPSPERLAVSPRLKMNKMEETKIWAGRICFLLMIASPKNPFYPFARFITIFNGERAEDRDRNYAQGSVCPSVFFMLHFIP
jgi:hypothetical protein